MNWIKLTEQKPDIRKEVLICYKTDDWSKEKQKYIKVKKVSIGYMDYLDKAADKYMWVVPYEYGIDAIAWMDLPKPI